LVEHAEDYPWSSALDHVTDDIPWRSGYTKERWREALRIGVVDEALGERIRRATMSGRPFGSPEFTEELELAVRRRLRPGQAGRPKKRPAEPGQQVFEFHEIGK